MVLQEVEVSQIINVLSYLYSVFSSVVQVDLYAVRSRSAFQVHKKINSLLTPPICCGKWSRKKSECFKSS